MTNSSTKQQIEQNKILKTIKEYAIMTIGMCIYSFGWIGCVLPAKSTSGAASGLAIVISTALHNTLGWDVKIGTIVLLINVVLLIAAGIILGWNFGISAAWIGIGNALVGSLLAWVVLGRRTRVMTQHLGSKTMPDFFEKRYDSKAMKLFAEAIAKFILGVVLVGVLIFLPAGTLHYWGGWLLMGILFVPMFLAGLVMMAKDLSVLLFMNSRIIVS